MPPPLPPYDPSYGQAPPLTDLDRIAEHMRFLGYTLHSDEAYDDKGGLFTATHDVNFNVTVRGFRGGILFGCVLRTTDEAKQNQHELAFLANACNQQAVFTRFVADADGDFVGEAFYAGPYEQQRFGAFLTAYDREVATLPGQSADLTERLLA